MDYRSDDRARCARCGIAVKEEDIAPGVEDVFCTKCTPLVAADEKIEAAHVETKHRRRRLRLIAGLTATFLAIVFFFGVGVPYMREREKIAAKEELQNRIKTVFTPVRANVKQVMPLVEDQPCDEATRARASTIGELDWGAWTFFMDGFVWDSVGSDAASIVLAEREQANADVVRAKLDGLLRRGLFVFFAGEDSHRRKGVYTWSGTVLVVDLADHGKVLCRAKLRFDTYTEDLFANHFREATTIGRIAGNGIRIAP